MKGAHMKYLSYLVVIFGLGTIAFANPPKPEPIGKMEHYSKEQFSALHKKLPWELQSAKRHWIPPYYATWYRPLAYCEAKSVVTGQWFYWYHWNWLYARYQALSLCVNYNGYTCVSGCTWTW